ALALQALLWAAALPASAQKTVKLFGNTYDVQIFGRDQTYKTAAGKQVKIVLTDPSTYTQKAGLYFAEGADPSKDRLLFACHSDDNNDTSPWHHMYMLTGAGDDGMFSPANTALTEFFGGAGDRTSGGRPLSVMLINDDDTGVGKDRNIITLQWTD